jgi:uncharacterized protein YdeI (YjbR/CyaY-like superfamily)
MGKKDPRIDAYIAKAAPFAQPILKHLRNIVHKGCPQVEETMKWSMPHFDYKGIMCGMAAHKQHCSFGFWQGSELALENGRREVEGMGHFGRITSLSDLPDDETLIGYVRTAVELKDAGVEKPKAPAPKKKRAELDVPDYFAAALRTNKKAQQTFDGFSYSHRKEYVQWVNEAKRDETRESRLATAIEWLAEGKPRNWKYERKSS